MKRMGSKILIYNNRHNNYNITAYNHIYMDFMMECCPYCGGKTNRNESGRCACQECGRNLYGDRSDLRSLVDPKTDEGGKYLKTLDAIEDGKAKAAVEIASDYVEEKGSTFSHVMRAMAYMYEGEDGRAFADLKAGFPEIKKDEIAHADPDTDAYICIIGKSVSDLIIYDEREFIDFDYINYLDRISDLIDSNQKCDCKGLLYATAFSCFALSFKEMDESERKSMYEIMPPLVHRAVAYSKEQSLMNAVIEEYKELSGYKPDTYAEDDNYDVRALEMLSSSIMRHLNGKDGAFAHGRSDSETKTSLEEYLTNILSFNGDAKAMDKLEKYVRKAHFFDERPNIEDAIEDYAQRYLQIK